VKNLYQTKTFLHVLKTAFVETPSRHDYGQRRQLLCNTSHIGFSRKWSQVLGTSELRDEMRFGPSLGLLWCKDAVPWNVLGRLMFISITAITFFFAKMTTYLWNWLKWNSLEYVSKVLFNNSFRAMPRFSIFRMCWNAVTEKFTFSTFDDFVCEFLLSSLVKLCLIFN